MATQTCSSCHGPRGESVSSAFPAAGWAARRYLEGQLRAFRDRTRGDPMAQAYMWGMASQLTMRRSTVSRPTTRRRSRCAGKARTRSSDEARKVDLRGRRRRRPGVRDLPRQRRRGQRNIPRLAGQHAEYLVKQLVLFKSQLRAGSNAPIMHNISAGMCSTRWRLSPRT